uniref:Syntaxinlike protein putative n=1 Tax=Albugo laibachii Nc14 TaxID=890382 RepID=F0WY65_9STRA|nr:syntaxinlike protein putative [Albugo laibachii Nc14]|eukprot:CCA26417.1 syntaxinlike protein putative [Albugo laibachii Nc14]
MAADRTSDFIDCCERYKRQVAPKRHPSTTSHRIPDPIQRNIQFNSAASGISKEICQASRRLQTLTQLVRQHSVFNDPTEAINATTMLVKKDITSITKQLDHLQEYVHSRGDVTKSQATHSEVIVSQMKSDLMDATQGFKNILETRQQNLKLQQDRRAKYGKPTSNSLGKPLTFEKLSSNTLPRPQGVITSDTNDEEHERKPLIAAMATQQLVSTDQNYTASRIEAVSQIESHIVDINQLFGRLSTLISEQGEQVQRVDDQVDDMVRNISAGENELLKYFSSLSNTRMLAFKIFAILFIFVVFFLLVLA